MQKKAGRVLTLNGESLAANGLRFDVNHANGDVTIIDESPSMELFNPEAVNTLSMMFGDRRTDEMLSEAAEEIDGEIFGMKFRNAFRNRKR